MSNARVSPASIRQFHPRLRLLLVALFSVCALLGVRAALPSPASDLPAAASAAPSAAGWRVSKSDNTGLTLEFSTPDYRVEDTASGQRIVVEGLASSSEAGKPQVPIYSVLIGVPPEAEISVEVLKARSMPLTDRVWLAPALSPRPPASDFQPGEYQSVRDAAAYASDAPYPGLAARIVEVAWLRDQRIARVEVYPFQYVPADQALIWHRQLTVAIKFGGSPAPDRPVPATTVDSPFEATLRDQLVNYDLARHWRTFELPPADRAVGAAPTNTTPRYKIVVDRDGLYRLTAAQLQAAGMDLNAVDPRTFRLTNQGRDVAIEVAGEADGQFDAADTLLFYGQQFRGDYLVTKYANVDTHWITYSGSEWRPHFTPAILERYTDENVYWLEVGGPAGPRFTSTDGTPAAAPSAAYFTATVRAEQSLRYNQAMFLNEDPWLWEQVATSAIVTKTYTTTLSGVANVPVSATVRGRIVSKNANFSESPDHRTQFRLNSLSAPFLDITWDGWTRLDFEGTVNQSDLISGVNSLRMTVMPQTAVPAEEVWFDWFEISYARQFLLDSGQLRFNAETGARRYQIGGAVTNTVHVLDVTNPLVPQRVLSGSISGASGAYSVTFEVSPTAPVTYFVAGNNAVSSPKSIGVYTPTDLSAVNGADYIIISHRAFITAMQSLADYRTARGLRVKVIDVDELYNQFTYGIYQPIAIREFLAYAYAQWQPPAPQYVLLVGDGHWNFKNFNLARYGSWPNFMPPYFSWVDPWQGEVDSTNLLVTVAGTDPLPDLFVGRFPVNTPAQASTIITKIISYEQSPTPAPWQQRWTMVADTVPDAAGPFEMLSDELLNDYLPETFAADKIYASKLGCVSGTCPQVNRAITATLNQTGSLLLHYIGHASINRWAGEQILVNANVSTLTNTQQLPIVLSMTCLDGYWNWTNVFSLQEDMLRASNGGSVAAWSPTGLGVASGHDLLERGFMQAAFVDGAADLGTAALAGKLLLYSGGSHFDLLHTFGILGDPALRMATYLPRLVTPQPSRDGLPAATVLHTVTVTNVGNLTDTLDFTLSGAEWPTAISAAELVIGPKANVPLIISVTVPATATFDLWDDLRLTAVARSAGVTLTADLTTTVTTFYRLALEPGTALDAAEPGHTVTYTLRLTNTGSISTDVLLAGTGEWPFTVTPTAVANLWPYADQEVTVTIHVPIDASGQNLTTITATAQGGVQPVAVAQLTTASDAIYGLTLDSPQAALSGDPASVVTYTVRVENVGNVLDTIDLVATQSDWPVTLSAPAVLLPPGGASEVQAQVEVPAGTWGGSIGLTKVAAISQRSGVSATLALTTTANAAYGLGLTPPSQAQSGKPGTTVTYTLHLSNTGNITATFALAISGHTWPVTVPASVGPVNVLGGAVITAVVGVPSAAVGSDTVTLQASAPGGSPIASVQLVTSAEKYGIYLPLMRR